MVLRKEILLLFGSILFSCITNNVYAQISEHSFDKGVEYFQKLEQVRDSAQYAHELYSIARYCRELGMYEESRIAGIKASKILSQVLSNKTPESKDDFTLYEENLDLNIFLLDLLTSRGDQYLDLSLIHMTSEASTLTIAGYTICNCLREGDSRNKIHSIYEQLEFPRLEHLNAITRYYWETGQTERIIKEINKAQRKTSWGTLADHERRILHRRLENACLLSSLSLATLGECLRIAKSMYYPVSVKDILYEQKLPEYFSMYREAARTCVNSQKPLYALKIYRLIERLIKKTIGDDFSFLLPSEQYELCEIMKPYFEEIQTFAYENHNLEGMIPFLYENILLMKELFAKPSFQYHRYLADSDSISILKMQSFIDSIALDRNSFKLQSPENRIKWLQNQVIRREQEKALISYVKKRVSPQFPEIKPWNEIAASLDSNEAVIEIFSLPYNVVNNGHAAIVFTKNKSPHLIELPPETVLMTAKDKMLYNNIWIPIKELIGECTHLYISSEETLSYLSFASIHNENEYIIDNYNFHYLFSSNDIPRIKSERTHVTSVSQKDIFFFGGAEFNYTPFFQTALQGFQYLQGTVDEIESIEKLLSNQWNIHKYMGKDATETSFRKLSGQSLNSAVIHISTHGFYILYNPKIQSDLLQLDGFSGHKNHLLHTGLAFSGANSTWNGLQPLGINDGILTAYEIASMNLSGTELVVLSGCDTGKGDVRYGKGNFSLQRAFRQAGVKSSIISFQNISDKETKELMVDFYRYWQEGINKQNAFVTAQRNMKNKYPNEPNKWAPFIFIE